jgi:DNA-binding SARP family transcriptional activator
MAQRKRTVCENKAWLRKAENAYVHARLARKSYLHVLVDSLARYIDLDAVDEKAHQELVALLRERGQR